MNKPKSIEEWKEIITIARESGLSDKTPLSKVDSSVYSAFMYGFTDKLIKQELGLVSTVTKRIFDYAYYKGYIQQNIALKTA